MRQILTVISVICLSVGVFAQTRKYPYANVYAAFQAGFEGKARPVAKATIHLVASRSVNGKLYFFDENKVPRVVVFDSSYQLAWWDGTSMSDPVVTDSTTIKKFFRSANQLAYQAVDLAINTNDGRVIDFPTLGPSYQTGIDAFQAGLEGNGHISTLTCDLLFKTR